MSVESFPPTPPSPHKRDPALNPNPHPYAIKTTSTALLSRSNSASNTSAAHYAYVPQSPRRTSRSPSKSQSRSEYRGHRYSTSLSDVAHSPERAVRSTSEDSPVLRTEDSSLAPPSPHRTKRAETLPSSASCALAGDADLPKDPKTWSPAQLAAYLAAALRAQDKEIADDVGAWVCGAGVTGRAFLRWDAPDLEALGVHAHWRPALLGAARSLRHSVLRGRIYGGGGDLYASSSSSLDLALSDADSDLKRTGALREKRAGNGRVRGMVDRWERESVGSREGSVCSESDAGSECGDASPDKPAPLPLPLPLATKPAAEPSVEELLAAEGDEGLGASGSWGARAWEDMGLGVTVKRVADAAPQKEQWDAVVAPKTGSGKSKGKGSFELRTRKGKDGSSGRVRAADERRVVTAIFAPSGEGKEKGEGEQEQEQGNGEDALQTRPTPLPLTDHKEAAGTDVETQRRAHEALVRSLEDRLAMSVQETRDLLETFRRRLVAVEARVEAMEAERLRREEDERHALAKPAAGADDADPDSFAALPSYVLLVGLGVCAVVLRVMLRRVAGRNLRP